MVNDMKKLVAYFSASGVTKSVAEKLADAAQADIFEIKPVTPYSEADLDWNDAGSRSSVEMNDGVSRPPIAEKVAGWNDYGVIFVGFPIWWHIAPTIINTFLESYDFAGKTVIPFCTSGSEGLGKTEDVLKALCPDTVRWRPGKLLNRRISKEKLIEWTDSVLK